VRPPKPEGILTGNLSAKMGSHPATVLFLAARFAAGKARKLLVHKLPSAMDEVADVELDIELGCGRRFYNPGRPAVQKCHTDSEAVAYGTESAEVLNWIQKQCLDFHL
jgi:hypothetical protein